MAVGDGVAALPASVSRDRSEGGRAAAGGHVHPGGESAYSLAHA